MRKIAVAACSVALLSACTSTLEPIGVRKDYSAFTKNSLSGCGWPSGMSLQELVAPETQNNAFPRRIAQSQEQEQQQQQTPKAASRLDWLSCEMLAKSMANFSQAESFANRTEWRDLPLIASVLTAATLVLFGERSANGNLKPGEVDVLEGLALGTGGFVLLSNYLAPEEAAGLLFQSARGHRCLAEHGQALSTYGDRVIGGYAATVAESLKENTAALRLAANEADGELKRNALTAIERADKALAFYWKQRTAREVAPARLYLVSYDFGMALTQKARRKPVDLGNLQTTLTQAVRLQTENAGIVVEGDSDPQNKTNIVPGDIAQLTRNVAIDTNALIPLVPNLAAVVAQMELCTSLALVDGSSLPRPEITFPGLTGS